MFQFHPSAIWIVVLLSLQWNTELSALAELYETSSIPGFHSILFQYRITHCTTLAEMEIFQWAIFGLLLGGSHSMQLILVISVCQLSGLVDGSGQSFPLLVQVSKVQPISAVRLSDYQWQSLLLELADRAFDYLLRSRRPLSLLHLNTGSLQCLEFVLAQHIPREFDLGMLHHPCFVSPLLQWVHRNRWSLDRTLWLVTWRIRDCMS